MCGARAPFSFFFFYTDNDCGGPVPLSVSTARARGAADRILSLSTTVVVVVVVTVDSRVGYVRRGVVVRNIAVAAVLLNFYGRAQQVCCVAAGRVQLRAPPPLRENRNSSKLR